MDTWMDNGRIKLLENTTHGSTNVQVPTKLCLMAERSRALTPSRVATLSIFVQVKFSPKHPTPVPIF